MTFVCNKLVTLHLVVYNTDHQGSRFQAPTARTSIAAVRWNLVKQNCVVTVALYKCRKMMKINHTTLKRLVINEWFVFHIPEYYKKTSWPRSLHLPNIMNAVCVQIYQNPNHKQKHIACQMNISAQAVNHILHKWFMGISRLDRLRAWTKRRAEWQKVPAPCQTEKINFKKSEN